jgi:hypothetical protein
VHVHRRAAFGVGRRPARDNDEQGDNQKSGRGKESADHQFLRERV